MLTQEERQRIEEEERKRIAEEQYRAEVRSKLKTESPDPVKQAARLPWIPAVGAVAVLIVGAFLWLGTKGRPPKAADDSAAVPQTNAAPVPKIRYVPQTGKIATGQILVRAGGYVQYRITITPEMSDASISGSFNASGGGGNDIEAVIADETNYTNWINGHQAQVFWQTGGRATTGMIAASLAPGTYYLVFSNRFSMFTEKQVFLDVDLNYTKAETYYE